MTAITNLPDLRPSLLLDFANSGRVDPRIQFTRASAATCYGPGGKLRTVAANVPRIDYDPATGKCLGLLVEESRTNLFTYSNAANEGWMATRSTLTPTGEVFGGLPVMRYTAADAISGYPYKIAFSTLFQVGKTYCLSAIIRRGTAPRCVVQFPVQNGFDSNHVLTIDTTTLATIGAVPANLVYGARDLGRGLFLVWVSATCTKVPGTPNYVPLSFPATVVGDYADICGLQLEEGSSPTSYIPTEASAVTRAADAVSVPYTTAGAGALFVHGRYDAAAPSVFFPVRASSEGNGYIGTPYCLGSGDVVRASYVRNDGGITSIASAPGGNFKVGPYKSVISWSGKNFANSTNGTISPSVTHELDLPVCTRIALCTTAAAGTVMGASHIFQIAGYGAQLSPQNMQRLTT